MVDEDAGEGTGDVISWCEDDELLFGPVGEFGWFGPWILLGGLACSWACAKLSEPMEVFLEHSCSVGEDKDGDSAEIGESW